MTIINSILSINIKELSTKWFDPDLLPLSKLNNEAEKIGRGEREGREGTDEEERGLIRGSCLSTTGGSPRNPRDFWLRYGKPLRHEEPGKQECSMLAHYENYIHMCVSIRCCISHNCLYIHISIHGVGRLNAIRYPNVSLLYDAVKKLFGTELNRFKKINIMYSYIRTFPRSLLYD